MASYTAFIPVVEHVRILTHGAINYSATVSPLLLDTVPPLVSLVSPAEGTDLQRTQSVVVDVMDESLGFHVILAYYPDIAGLHEVVFGGVWPPTEGMYNISRQAISSPRPGFRYTFHRRGGWPARPRIQVRATDHGSGEVM